MGFGELGSIVLSSLCLSGLWAGSLDLMYCILPDRLMETLYLAVDYTKVEWRKGYDQPPPPHPDMRQKAWDIPRVQETYNTLLENAEEPRSRAKLLVVAVKESGSLLNALPISALGLRINGVVRATIELRLGIPLCCPCDTSIAEERFMNWPLMVSTASRVQASFLPCCHQ